MIVTWVFKKEIKTLRQEEPAMKRQRRMKRSWMGRILEKTFDPCKKKKKKETKRRSKQQNMLYTRIYTESSGF
jgi:hypothetical protein